MPVYQLTIDFMDGQQDRYVSLFLIDAVSFDAAMVTAQSICNAIGSYSEALPLLATLAAHVPYNVPQRVAAGSVNNVLKLKSETTVDPIHGRAFSFDVSLPAPVDGLFEVDNLAFDQNSPSSLLFLSQIVAHLCDIRANSYSHVVRGIKIKVR